jgi:hypothetical protein
MRLNNIVESINVNIDEASIPKTKERKDPNEQEREEELKE